MEENFLAKQIEADVEKKEMKNRIRHLEDQIKNCTTLSFFQHPAMMQEKGKEENQPVQRNLWEMKEL